MVGRVVLDSVRKLLPKYAWKYPLERCRVKTAGLGERAGAVGAAALVLEMLKTKKEIKK